MTVGFLSRLCKMANQFRQTETGNGLISPFPVLSDEIHVHPTSAARKFFRRRDLHLAAMPRLGAMVTFPGSSSEISKFSAVCDNLNVLWDLT